MSGWKHTVKVAAVALSVALIALIAVWNGGAPVVPEVRLDSTANNACAHYEKRGTPCTVINMGTTVIVASARLNR